MKPTQHLSKENVRSELSKLTKKYHIMGCWAAILLNPVWAVSDYLIIPSYWELFLAIRFTVALATLFAVLFREKIRLSSEALIFIPFLGISLQNAFMYSVMDAAILQKHTFAYIALFLGASMLVVWRPVFSVAVFTISLVANIILFKIFSPLSTEAILIGGGLLTASVALMSIALTHLRYSSIKKEIISRLTLADINEELQVQKEISERNASELQKREELYRIIAQNLPAISIIMFDHELKCIVGDGRALELQGYDRESLPGKLLTEALPDGRGRKEEKFYSAALKGITTEIEEEYQTYFFKIHYLPLLTAGGKIIGGLKVAENITDVKEAENSIKQTLQALTIANTKLEQEATERERAQKQLAESEEQYRSFAETATDAIITINENSAIQFVNTATEKIFGYTREELLGEQLTKLIPNRHHEAHKQGVRKYVETGSRNVSWQSLELSGVRRNGEEFPLEVSFSEWIKDGKHFFTGIARDITERKKADEKFRLAIEAAPNALVMVSKDGKINLANKQAEKLFGYTRQEMLGKPIEMLVPERFRGKHPHQRDLFFGHPQSRPMGAGRDLYGQHKDGSEVPIEIGLNPIEIDGNLIVLASIIDITERRKAEILLKEAKEKAEQTATAKQEFLSIMSHEIRTPLHAVLGITHLLLEEDPKESQISHLKLLQFSGDNLLSLINNILDFSKIESGKIQLEKTRFSLHDLLEKVTQSFHHISNEKQIVLDLDTDKNIPESLVGEPARLTQILNNLVNNAVKFTDAGSVTLSAAMLSRSANEAEILFRVKDTGIGIEKEKQHLIFESFTQADSSITREFGGTGLGLTICQRLIRLLGGDIHVESEKGKGSAFSFTLSFDTRQENFQASTTEDKLPTPNSLSGIRILIAEDNKTNQLLAKKFLEKWGAEVDVADNGMIAIEKLHLKIYHLVLMDLFMPLLDGFGAAKLIREMGFTSEKLPIVALSAHTLDEAKAQTLQAGMDDFIPKPIVPNQLFHTITKHLFKRKLVNGEEENYEFMDIRQLLDSFDQDPEFKSEYIRLLISEFSEFPGKIADASFRDDKDSIRYLIHKISPVLKRIDNTPLSRQLEKLIEQSNPNGNENSSIENTLREIESSCDEIVNMISELE